METKIWFKCYSSEKTCEIIGYQKWKSNQWHHIATKAMLRFRNKTEAGKAYEAIFVLLDTSSEALPTLQFAHYYSGNTWKSPVGSMMRDLEKTLCEEGLQELGLIFLVKTTQWKCRLGVSMVQRVTFTCLQWAEKAVKALKLQHRLDFRTNPG